MTRRVRIEVTVVLAMAIIIPIVGCGDPYQLAPVSGRVTYDGKPLEGATVIFSPMNAPEKTGRPRMRAVSPMG